MGPHPPILAIVSSCRRRSSLGVVPMWGFIPPYHCRAPCARPSSPPLFSTHLSCLRQSRVCTVGGDSRLIFWCVFCLHMPAPSTKLGMYHGTVGQESPIY